MTAFKFLTVFGSNDNKEHLNNSTVESRIENPNGRIFNVLVNVDGTATTNLTLKNGDDSGIIDLIDMYDTIKFINDNEKPQLFKIMRHEYVCPVRDIVPHRSNQRFEVNSNKDCKVYSSIEFYRVLAPKTYTTYRILVRSGTVYYPGRKNNITTTYELVKPQSLLVDVN